MAEPSSRSSPDNDESIDKNENSQPGEEKLPCTQIPNDEEQHVHVEDTTETHAHKDKSKDEIKDLQTKPSSHKKSDDATKQPQDSETVRKDPDPGTTQLLALAAIAAAAQPRQESETTVAPLEIPSTKPKEKPTIPRAPSSLSNSSSETSQSKPKSFRRRGKWTPEEETYVARVIQEFNSGYLPAVPGTTLRSYLSDKLQCDPMRITKKFTGEACIGKRVFHPAIRTESNAEAFDNAVRELQVLEDNWRRRLELQQRESAKKAAVSALPTEHTTDPSVVADVTQTASWLDRAKIALTTTNTDIDSVERLIHEGTDHKRLRRATDQEAFVGFLKSVHARHQE